MNEIDVTVFSEGKTSQRNEDFCGHSDTTFVIADGATDKSGKRYDGKTGGEIVSRLLVERALVTDLNGVALVEFLQREIALLYQRLGITEIMDDPKNRFTSGLIVARIVDDELAITYIGDLGFRVNGEELYQEVKQIDIDNAELRAHYIRETGNVEGSYAYMLPRFLGQFVYQNSTEHVYGYGVLDGTKTPVQFVKTFLWKRGDVRTLELFTDGYFAIPVGTSIEDWEAMHAVVEQEDPNKYLTYKSVSSKDDRTIMIVRFA